MEAEERRKNDKRMDLLERTIYGEQINGNRTIGIFEKVNLMYEQFVFMFRIYKVVMAFTFVATAGIITIIIKLFTGGGS